MYSLLDTNSKGIYIATAIASRALNLSILNQQALKSATDEQFYWGVANRSGGLVVKQSFDYNDR